MPSVLVSTQAGVMTVTLNRPDKLNAFVAEMHGLLREAMHARRNRRLDPRGAPHRRGARLSAPGRTSASAT